MATVGRAIRLGLGWGALGGAFTGAGVAAALLIGSAGVGPQELVVALILYGVMGGLAGAVAGAATGLVLGLLVGATVNLLLGPAAQVPRRCGQQLVVRFAAAMIGLLPLLAVPATDDWWLVAAVVAILSSGVIAAKAPAIAGIAGCEGRA